MIREDAEDKNTDDGKGLLDLSGRLYSVHVGHLGVHNDHIWKQLPGSLHGLQAISGKSNHSEAVCRVKQAGEGISDGGRVVDDQDLNHLAFTIRVDFLTSWYGFGLPLKSLDSLISQRQQVDLRINRMVVRW